MIFGYKSWNDYWLQVLDLSNTQKVYHVVNGTKSLIGSGSWSNGAGSAQGLYVSDTRRYLFSGFGYSFGSSGMTSGQVGLFTTVANTKFTPFSVYEDSSSRDMAGRWTNWQPNLDGLNAVNPSTSRYKSCPFREPFNYPHLGPDNSRDEYQLVSRCRAIAPCFPADHLACDLDSLPSGRV